MAEHEISLEDAVSALRDHFGERLEAGRDEGQDMMVEMLVEHFKIGKGEASQLVDVLEQARTIQWIERGDVQDLAIGVPSTGQGMPLGNVDSYWQF